MLRSSAHLNDNLFHFFLEAQRMKMRQQKFSPSLCTNTLLTDLLIQKGPLTMFPCLLASGCFMLSWEDCPAQVVWKQT